MDVPLTIAGSIGLLAAAVHGIGGELSVVRKLAPETLPATRFGGPRMTLAMIHVSWHVATVAFLATGAVLLLSGTALEGETPRAILVVAAAAATGYAALAAGLGATYNRRSALRAFARHPGPIVLTAGAVMAWVGAL
jgi:hypothetical protein